MRRLLLIPLLLAGCEPVRRAAVSGDGRVASTVAGGTFVTGRGRVAEGGLDLAWSADGQTLAISTAGGTLLWPSGGKIAGMRGPYAWSPDGSALAGDVAGSHVAVRTLATGEMRRTELATSPSGLRWTPDGKLLAWNPGRIEIEGGKRLQRKGRAILDVATTPDGEVVWLETASIAASKGLAAAFSQPLRLGRWNPGDGRLSSVDRGRATDLLSPASTRRAVYPFVAALAPGGESFALGGVVVEASARTLARLRVLSDKKAKTKAEGAEADRLSRSLRGRAVIVRATGSGASTTLWNAPVDLAKESRGIEDLAYSPDGRWLAIARRDGTVRVAAGG